MTRWKYTLEGQCTNLEVHSIPSDPDMVRIKLSHADGLFTRTELEAMLVLLANVLKDQTP